MSSNTQGVITKIVSFDPASYRNMGWCIMDVVEKEEKITNIALVAGTFVVPKILQPWQALWPLFSMVDDIFSKRVPDLAVIEKTSSFSGGFITGQVSNCMGAILACCGKFDVPVAFVYPSHVKKVITGKGKATKKQIKNSVVARLSEITGQEKDSFVFDSEHAYDAIANILCFLTDKGFLGENGEQKK